MLRSVVLWRRRAAPLLVRSRGAVGARPAWSDARPPPRQGGGAPFVRLAPGADGRLAVEEGPAALGVRGILSMDPSLAARDLRVFPGLDHETTFGGGSKAESELPARRSGFHVIGRRGTVLVSLPGPIEALLRHDCAVVMSGAEEMRSALSRTLAAGAPQAHIPWELLVLETALSVTLTRLRAKVGRLVPVIQHELERMAKESKRGGKGMARGLGLELQRLLPLKHQLSHLTSEAHEIIRGLASLGADPQALADLLLTAKHQRDAGGTQVRDAEAASAELRSMLAAYGREADACLHSLRNAHEEVDNTQELLAVALEGGTNALLHINLRLSTATLATAATAVPAAVLGMNVPSGLEENTAVFWPLTGALALCAAAVYSLVMRSVSGSLAESARHAERISAERSALAPATLEGVERVLLRAHHADPGARISKAELARLLAADPHAPTPSDREMAAIFAMLDLDDDGTVHHSEFFRLARGRTH